AHDGELDRKSTRIEHATPNVLGKFAKMPVARRRFRPRVADADHRTAVELVVRDALVLHPRAVHERVPIVTAEPFCRAKLALGSAVVGHIEVEWKTLRSELAFEARFRSKRVKCNCYA